MEDNKCPQCGAPIDPNEKECKFCGEKIVVQQPTAVNGISINIGNNFGNFSDDGEISALQKALAVSAHLGYILGGLGLLIWPIALYILTEKRMPFVQQHAIQAFKAQIACGLLAIIVLMGAAGAGVGMLIYAALVFVLLVPFSFYAAYKAIIAEEYYYPLLKGGFTKEKAIILGGIFLVMIFSSLALK